MSLAATDASAPAESPKEGRASPSAAGFLSAEGLSRAYTFRRAGLFRRAATFRAVADVSLTLARGRTLGVVGESGCGKSTLGLMLAGLLSPSAGRVTVEGTESAALSPAAWRASRQHVQVIFQDAPGSLDPRLPVELQVREPLDLHGIGDRAARIAATQEMLGAVKLGEHLWRAVPGELSGGQQQRVVIARALILRPGLLICDEPVSALDVSIQAQVVMLLAEMRRALGLTMVFISHDLAVVRQIADDIAVMYLGRVVEQGPADAVLDTPRHPYTAALRAAMPVPDPARAGIRTTLTGDPPSPHTPPPGCPFHTRCPRAAPRCAAELPRPRRLGRSILACHFPVDPA